MNPVELQLIRYVAGVIVISLVKIGVVDPGVTETLTDILTMVFVGIGFLLFIGYEIYHRFYHRTHPVVSDEEIVRIQPYRNFLGRLVDGVVGRLFEKEKKTEFVASTSDTPTQ